jgi:hypothetical protein
MQLQSEHVTVPPDRGSEGEVRSASGNDAAPKYTSWAQVSGYSDGDGSVEIKVNDWVLWFALKWVDNWRPQLNQLHDFLAINEIRSSFYHREGAWQLSVLGIGDVIRAAKGIIPFTSKKRAEFVAVVDYLEDKITGSQAIEVFNKEVVQGQRIGRLREANLPYTRKHGLELGRLRKSEILSALTTSQKKDVIRLHNDLGVSASELAIRYGVKMHVIRRVLRRQ